MNPFLLCLLMIAFGIFAMTGLWWLWIIFWLIAAALVIVIWILKAADRGIRYFTS